MTRPALPSLIRLLGLAALVALGGAVGCAPQTVQLQTAHYTLGHPDYWKVKQQASKDGEATVVVIPPYGNAVIDTGSGAGAGQSYDAVTADVEVRLYSAPDPNANADATQEVSQILRADPELALNQHFVIPDNPPECGMYPKKYRIFGVTQAPIDLVKRPGWRTIVVGGRANGYLLGAVARVEYEPDMQRNCHNLANMQVQLQNLFDALTPSGGPAAPPASGSGPPPEATQNAPK